MFDDVVVLTETEYEAYVIACLETEFGADYPDPADFVVDEHQRFLDSRVRLLSPARRTSTRRWRPGEDASRAEASPRPGAGRVRPQPPGGDVRPRTR